MVLTPTKPYCYAVLTAHITYLWHAPTVSLDMLDRAYGANNMLVIAPVLPWVAARFTLPRSYTLASCLLGRRREGPY